MEGRSASPLISLLVVAALGPCAVASVIRDDGTESASLSLGASLPFASAARLSIAGATGSGTLVTPEWVLTAAHVVTNQAGVTLPLASITVTINGEARAVSAVSVRPGWSGGNFTSAFDLALVRLASPVVSVAPASLFSGPGPIGSEVALVGYGSFGYGSMGFVRQPGTLHGATNLYDALGSEQFSSWSSSLMLMDLDSPTTAEYNRTGGTFATGLEGVPASGDSGGGSFVLTGGGWRLAGVHSFTYTNGPVAGPGGYGTGAADILVADHAAWINSVIPAPGGAAALAAAALLACRRRRE